VATLLEHALELELYEQLKRVAAHGLVRSDELSRLLLDPSKAKALLARAELRRLRSERTEHVCGTCRWRLASGWCASRRQVVSSALLACQFWTYKL
jgi:hypothetical protein